MVWGFRFGAQVFGLTVSGLGLGFWVHGAGFSVYG